MEESVDLSFSGAPQNGQDQGALGAPADSHQVSNNLSTSCRYLLLRLSDVGSHCFAALCLCNRAEIAGRRLDHSAKVSHATCGNGLSTRVTIMHAGWFVRSPQHIGWGTLVSVAGCGDIGLKMISSIPPSSDPTNDFITIARQQVLTCVHRGPTLQKGFCGRA
eukprot:708672-Amphidinium_carterae.1